MYIYTHVLYIYTHIDIDIQPLINSSSFFAPGLHDMARPAREEALHTSIATAAACSLAFGLWRLWPLWPIFQGIYED